MNNKNLGETWNVQLNSIYIAERPSRVLPPVPFQQSGIVAHELEAVEEIVGLRRAVDDDS